MQKYLKKIDDKIVENQFFCSPYVHRFSSQEKIVEEIAGKKIDEKIVKNKFFCSPVSVKEKK